MDTQDHTDRPLQARWEDWTIPGANTYINQDVGALRKAMEKLT